MLQLPPGGQKQTYSRHEPVTLEDNFTLIHQSLMALISDCKEGVVRPLINTAYLPQDFKEILHQIDEINAKQPHKMQKYAIEIADNEIFVAYNIPLRNHSAKMKLRYDRATGKVSIKGCLLGTALDRWGQAAYIANIFDHFRILSLAETPRRSAEEVVLQWKIQDISDISKALELFQDFCVQSMLEGDDPHRLLLDPRYGLTPVLLLDFAKKRLQQSNSATSRYDHALVQDMENCLDLAQKNSALLAAPYIGLETCNQLLRKKIPGAVELAINSLLHPSNPNNIFNRNKVTSDVINMLLEEGYDISRITKATNKALLDPNPQVRIQGLDILNFLASYEVVYDETCEAILRAVNDTSADVQSKAVELLKSSLINCNSEKIQKPLKTKILSTAEEVAKQSTDLARKVMIYSFLCREGRCILNEATSLLQNAFQYPNIWNGYIVRDLAIPLIERGLCHEEAIAFCERADDINIRNIYGALFKKEKGVESALKVAQRYLSERKPIFDLSIALLKRNEGIERCARVYWKV